jgi:DNA-directed RNA polymerase subunit RPC12/RpoP
MFRFSCPKCCRELEEPESAAGSMMECPSCGVRLMVPLPPPSKLPPGAIMSESDVARPAPASPAAPSPAAQKTQVRTLNGKPHVCWPCIYCQTELASAVANVGLSVQCPTCNQQVPIPSPPTGTELAARYSPPPRPAYGGGRGPDREPEPEPEPPGRSYRPPRLRRNRERFEDDLIRQPGPHARAANAGLTCGVFGLGLFLVLFFLFMSLVSHHPSRDSARGVAAVSLLIVLASFILSLLGVVFGARGMSPVNDYNRGMGIAGLVCGIVGLVLNCFCGLALLGGFVSNFR